MRFNRITLRSPELTLKGRNRAFFEAKLVENVAHRLRGLGFDWPVSKAHGRVYVDIPANAPPDLSPVLQGLSEVAGVESLAAALRLRSAETRQATDSPATERIENTLVEMADRTFEEGMSFAIRVNRVDKRLPMTSNEMERWLGQAVRDRTGWDRVDLSHPDRVFSLDIYADGIYLWIEKVAGIGGLPVGSSGRVLALLSGGIDSPVAAFELAKRGCRVDFLHVTATFAQQRDDDSPVVRLARSLSRFTLRSRLFTVPATHLDLALAGPYTGYEPILFRRFLMRLGEVLARRIGALALVTGDSLGQVASQTLENLDSVYRSTRMPILQPLIGSNKQQTVDRARRIGTFDISTERYKDCCALLASSPRTHSRPAQLEGLESERLPHYEDLLSASIGDLVWRTFDCGAPVDEWHDSPVLVSER